MHIYYVLVNFCLFPFKVGAEVAKVFLPVRLKLRGSKQDSLLWVADEIVFPQFTFVPEEITAILTLTRLFVTDCEGKLLRQDCLEFVRIKVLINQITYLSLMRFVSQSLPGSTMFDIQKRTLV